MTALETIKKALDGVSSAFNRVLAEAPAESDHYSIGLDCTGKAIRINLQDMRTITELLSTLESLQRENEELSNLADRLKQEAQTHAMEARGANTTIAEIYQIISGGKGEPGNWRGAKPVREYVEAAKGEILRLETELALSKPVYSRRQIEARVKLLEEALTPFGREGEKWHEMWPDDHIPAIHPKGNVCGSCGAEPDCDVGRFTVGDLRRARTALASTGGEHHAE